MSLERTTIGRHYERAFGSSFVSMKGRPMKRILKFVVCALAVTASLVVATGTASADRQDTSCRDDGHELRASAFYVNSGAYHVWTSAIWTLGGNGTGGESNLNFTVKENGAVRYTYKSGDNLVNNRLYQHNMAPQPRTYGGYQEWVTFFAEFDTAGDDPKCYADTNKI